LSTVGTLTSICSAITVFALPVLAREHDPRTLRQLAATVEDLVNRTCSARSSSSITGPGEGRFVMPHRPKDKPQIN